MTRLPTAVVARLRDEIHARCFEPSAPDGLPRVGAEVEFLVVDASTRRPVPLEAGHRSVLRIMRAHAKMHAWCEGRTTSDTPRFEAVGQAAITFEPGGQLEISTVACESPNALLRTLDAVVSPLRDRLTDEGVELLAVGIDPETPIECVPLQLHVDRYERMTRYFDRIGPFGVRMMRQTAAVQVSVDRGPRPADRWRLLNNLSPILVAAFANSPRYTGQDSRHKSFRARCWRMLDSGRTGIIESNGDPADEYATFALGANDMMREDASGEHRPFGEWVASGDWNDDRWNRHLTTLFPEVRPRGHFEIRSCDAVDPSWYPALVVFVTGLVYDERAAREADRMLMGKGQLLTRAGQCGLTDPVIARTARELTQLALEGASRFPSDYLDRLHIERARETFETYTLRNLSPADSTSS